MAVCPLRAGPDFSFSFATGLSSAMPDRTLALAAASRSGWQRDKVFVKLDGYGNDGDLMYRKPRQGRCCNRV